MNLLKSKWSLETLLRAMAITITLILLFGSLASCVGKIEISGFTFKIIEQKPRESFGVFLIRVTMTEMRLQKDGNRLIKVLLIKPDEKGQPWKGIIVYEEK